MLVLEVSNDIFEEYNKFRGSYRMQKFVGQNRLYHDSNATLSEKCYLYCSTASENMFCPPSPPYCPHIQTGCILVKYQKYQSKQRVLRIQGTFVSSLIMSFKYILSV